MEAAALSPEEAGAIGADQSVTKDTLKYYKKYGGEFLNFFTMVNNERKRLGQETIALETHYINAVLYYARIHMGVNPARGTVRGRKAGIEMCLEIFYTGWNKFWKTDPIWKRMWESVAYRGKSDRFSTYQIIDAGLLKQDLESISTQVADLLREGEGEDPEDHLPSEVQKLRRGAVTEEMLTWLFLSDYFIEMCKDYNLDPEFIQLALEIIFECALRRGEFFSLIVGGYQESSHTLHVDTCKAANRRNSKKNYQLLSVLEDTHAKLIRAQKGRGSGLRLFPIEMAPYAFLNKLISGAAEAGVGTWDPRLKYTLHSLRHGGLQHLWSLYLGRMITKERFYKLGHTSEQCAHQVYLIPNDLRVRESSDVIEVFNELDQIQFPPTKEPSTAAKEVPWECEFAEHLLKTPVGPDKMTSSFVSTLHKASDQAPKATKEVPFEAEFDYSSLRTVSSETGPKIIDCEYSTGCFQKGKNENERGKRTRKE